MRFIAITLLNMKNHALPKCHWSNIHSKEKYESFSLVSICWNVLFHCIFRFTKDKKNRFTKDEVPK